MSCVINALWIFSYIIGAFYPKTFSTFIDCKTTKNSSNWEFLLISYSKGRIYIFLLFYGTFLLNFKFKCIFFVCFHCFLHKVIFSTLYNQLQQVLLLFPLSIVKHWIASVFQPTHVDTQCVSHKKVKKEQLRWIHQAFIVIVWTWHCVSYADDDNSRT